MSSPLQPATSLARTFRGPRAQALFAGAAALLWSQHPEWTYKEVKDRLMESVDKVPSLVGKTVTGGRLNIGKALGLD